MKPGDAVAQENEEAAIAIVRRRSRAVPGAIVESLGPVPKAELKRRRVWGRCGALKAAYRLVNKADMGSYWH